MGLQGVLSLPLALVLPRSEIARKGPCSSSEPMLCWLVLELGSACQDFGSPVLDGLYLYGTAPAPMASPVGAGADASHGAGLRLVRMQPKHLNLGLEAAWRKAFTVRHLLGIHHGIHRACCWDC